MRQTVIVAIAAAALVVLMAGPAFAFHCYVEDKPAGAGAGTFADIQPAGESGKLYITGAFLDGSEFGIEEDIFLRGQPVDVGVQGVGTLPQAPHDSGSEEHGVNSLP